MFEFFTRHTLPARAAVRHVQFATPSPGVSSNCHWASVEAQIHALQISSIDLGYDPGKRSFAGTTSNVGRLALDLGHLPLELAEDLARLDRVDEDRDVEDLVHVDDGVEPLLREEARVGDDEEAS